MLGVTGEGMKFALPAMEKTEPMMDVAYLLLVFVGIAVQYFYGRFKIRIKIYVTLPLFCTLVAILTACAIYIPKGFFDGHIPGDDEFIIENDADVYKRCANVYGVVRLVGVNQYTAKYISVALSTDRAEEKEKVVEFFNNKAEHNDNEHTGEFEGKNVIVVLMESIDDWLITPETMPTLSKMKSNSYWFDNFYTSGFGALTFNSEYAVNTGNYNPITGESACLYINNSYNNAMARLFEKQGYSAESFHANKASYYSRGRIHRSWGYENMNSYIDSYKDGIPDGVDMNDDRILYLNEDVYQKFAHRSDKFMNYLVTISGHFPYVDNEATEAAFKLHPEYRNKTDDKKINGLMAQARQTDDMFEGLLKRLEEDGQLENTVIIGFTDHYAYDLSDEEVSKMCDVRYDDKNMFQKNCLFIYNPELEETHVNKVCNTSDVLPTIVNLFKLSDEYPYIGNDIFDDGYEGIAYFADKSWVTNKGYYNGGIIFADEDISVDEINKNNQYVSDVLDVNGAMVKYDITPGKEDDK
jgi:phosphoglycerol transferase MdoB-like AlkP superfamily enzyme